MGISNYTKRFLSKLIFSIFISQLCRFAFFIAHQDKYSQCPTSEIFQCFFFGQIFDNIGILYFCSIYFIFIYFPTPWRFKNHFQNLLDFFLGVGLTIICLLNIQDIIVYSITKKRTGYDSLFFLDADLINVMPKFILNYWYAFIFLGLLIFLIFKVINLINKRFPIPDQKWNSSLYIKYSIWYCIYLLMAVSFLRGWNLRPIMSIDASKYVSPKLTSLILNTPMQMISTFQSNGLQSFHFFSDEEAESRIGAVKFNPNAQPNHMNVCIIIMESMGKEYIGHFNKGKGYTPFLDSLFSKSLVFEHSYANGVFSKHGIVATLGGVPALLSEPLMNSSYQSNEIESLGKYLGEIGYDCSFYHGGRNGTMNFDHFIAQSSFGKYYGKNEYIGKPEDDDGSWGISDEPYLQYWAEELNKKKKPFCSAVFTLSNHDPYRVPKDHINTFTKGDLPIHKTAAYTDYAIEQFFKKASKTEWFENTLFVITADHTSLSNNNYYFSQWNRFAIPIAFYIPNKKIHADSTRTVQQIDIMPSILDLTGYNKKYFCMGNSIFSNNRGYAYQIADNNFQIESDTTFVRFDGKNITYNQNINEIGMPTQPTIDSLNNYLKAVLQVFSKRMKTNNYKRN